MEIGIWGDSITYGQCDTEALGWVGRLRKSLPIDDYVGVYNFGVCGDTTQDVLARFSTEANSMDPNIILFAVGINDSKFPKGKNENNVSLEEFKVNMGQLIQLAKGFTEKVYIIGATKVDVGFETSKGSRFFNRDIEEYNTALKELAHTNTLSFIDVYDVLNPTDDLFDGLHPNAEGYQKMFETITSELKLVAVNVT